MEFGWIRGKTLAKGKMYKERVHVVERFPNQPNSDISMEKK